jgi:hypothetical protein
MQKFLKSHKHSSHHLETVLKIANLKILKIFNQKNEMIN